MGNTNSNLKKQSLTGFLWKASQNISAQLISLVIQIVLARILMPEDYGIVALTSVIISVLTVFVQTGFTSAIIQKTELSETDKSSMFFLSAGIGLVLYGAMFVCSPLIANYYNEPLLTAVFRVQTVSMVITSFCAVHNSLITRELLFKKSFVANLTSVIIQGVIGIGMALLGYGVWALVVSTLAKDLINSALILFTYRWIPKLRFSIKSIRAMLAFSATILIGNVLTSVYNSCRTLIIGKLYDAQMVAYYNRGHHFPAMLMVSIDGAMTTVLFSALSKLKDDPKEYVGYLRKSMKISITVITPLMCGMAAVADPMVRLLLTDKWESAIPFVMITCASCLTWPLSAKAHALNSLGKSGINLAINIAMKVVAILSVIVSIPFGVYVMCLTSVADAIISVLVYCVVISKHCDYPVRQQLTDVIPIYLLGFIMFGVVYGLSLVLQLSHILELVILVCTGAAVYVSLSFLFRMEGFLSVWGLLKKVLASVCKKSTERS